MNFNPLVPTEHYLKDYDTKQRFISYWNQINEVLKTNPKKVLEIGPGNKTVANYLKSKGIDVTTVDVDKGLNPDFVCSVTELSTHFEKDSFDTVLCAEVLEHIPFEYLEKALTELHYVCRESLILSLPDSRVSLMSTFKIPIIGIKTISIKVPSPVKHQFNGEHYWEIGKVGYSLGKITRILKRKYQIVKRFNSPEDIYHLFFVLKKRHTTYVRHSGILEWFNKPAGVHYHATYDRTYFAWINHEGMIEIRYYDHDTASMSDVYEVDDLNDISSDCPVDDHNAPTVYVRDDGKIIVFYSTHRGGLYYKKSVNAEDISFWEGRHTIEGRTEEACYPKPRKVGKDLWLFYRYKYAGNQRQEAYRVSTSDGDGWSDRKRLIEFKSKGDKKQFLGFIPRSVKKGLIEFTPTGVKKRLIEFSPIGPTTYVFIATSGNEIHLAWSIMSNYGRNQKIRNIYYMYSRDGGINWNKRNGTPVNLPCSETEADLVFDSKEDQCYMWDLVLDADNNPFIVFACKEDPDHEFRFARYDNGWLTHRITDSSQLYDASHFYSGGAVIDPNNVYQVYLSKKHVQLEIERWESSDEGQSWSKGANITSDSVKDNFRPQVVKDYHRDFILLWVYGDYTGLINKQWTGWNTEIQSYPVKSTYDSA